MTDPACPLLCLDDRRSALVFADTKSAHDLTPREFALQSAKEGRSHDWILGAIAAQYGVDRPISPQIAIAIVECAVSQTVTKTCPFAFD